MGEIDYSSLVAGLIKPLVTHPEKVTCEVQEQESYIHVNVIVDQMDLGRVIGRKGRVAGAIRTIVYAVAKRKDQKVEIEFQSNEEAE